VSASAPTMVAVKRVLPSVLMSVRSC
jgi:hypothetical protein